MLLSTMTYEEIYREIRNDFRDVLDYYKKAVEPKVCKSAQKALRYPWYKFDLYIHPQSHNKYFYFSIVKKHSLWNKPVPTVFCEYEGQYGKEIITAAIWKDRRTFKPVLMISVFQAHFFKRYQERFIKKDELEVDKIPIFLARNGGALQISSEAVSTKELLKDEPGYNNAALLNLDGLCLGKVSIENPNIYIYKTFLPFDELHSVQNEKVLPEYIRMLATQACEDYPQCSKTINDTYMEAAIKFRDILLGDNQMTHEERFHKYLQEYSKVCHELYEKYIIV